jgi:type IV secretory pathway VirJ component
MTGASARSAPANIIRRVFSFMVCANRAPGPAVAVAADATRIPATGSTCPADANTAAPLRHVATFGKSAVELAWSCARPYAA